MKLFLTKNGMKVLLIKAPTNSVNIAVGVFCGAFYPRAKAGVAHMVEHNLFSDEDSYLDKIGTYIEAYTNDFYTTYQVRTTKDKMFLCLDILLDKIFNAKLNEVFFNNEKKVIYEEYLKQKGNYMSDNAFRALNKFYEGTFIGNSGYGIGDKKQIEEITFNDVAQFYKKNYTYSNSVLVVVGNFDLKKVEDVLYEDEVKCIDKLKNIDIGMKSNKSLQILNKKMKMDTSVVDITFSATNFLQEDLITFELLSYIIGAGENSLIKRRLRKQLGIIYQCDCSVDGDIVYKNCGTMSIRYYVGNKNVEKSIREVFALLKNSKNEIQKMLPIVKEQYINNLNIKCDNIEFISEINIKSILLLGRPFVLKNEISRIKKVSENDILACLNHVFENQIVISVSGKEIGSLKNVF